MKKICHIFHIFLHISFIFFIFPHISSYSFHISSYFLYIFPIFFHIFLKIFPQRSRPRNTSHGEPLLKKFTVRDFMTKVDAIRILFWPQFDVRLGRNSIAKWPQFELSAILAATVGQPSKCIILGAFFTLSSIPF